MTTQTHIGVRYKTLIFGVAFLFFLFFSFTAFAQISGETGTLPSDNTEQTFGTPLNPNDPNLLPSNNTGQTIVSKKDEVKERNPNENVTEIGLAAGFMGTLQGLVIFLGGKLLAWAAALFSASIINFVVGYGQVYLNWGVGVAVNAAWEIIRDVFNIAFIFGILFIGIKLILNADDSSAKRSLGYLLAAALLINFSLFISKFVIDAANSLAAIIFTTGLYGISDNPGQAFVNLLGLSTVFGISPAGGNVEGVTPENLGAAIGILIGTLLLLLVTAFVLFAGGILLIMRAVVLIFFMVFSPIMFLGWIFPSFQNFTSLYWKMFLGNAFMAPAYLFCVYLSFTVLESFKIQLNSPVSEVLTTGNNVQLTQAIVFYTLAIIFMGASVVVAKRMGAVGASTAVSIGNKLRGAGRSAIKSVGRGATYFPRWGAQELTAATGGKLARSFDRLQTSDSALGKIARLNAVSRATKGATGAMKGAKFGMKYTVDEENKYKEQTNSRYQNAQNIRGITRLEELRGKSTLNPAETAELATLTAAESKMRSSVTGMSSEEFEKLSQSEREKIAPLLTNSQVDKFLESKELDPADKKKITEARQKAIEKTLTGTSGIITEELVRLTTEQLETMGDKFISDNAHLLSGSQIDDLKKSKKFNETQKNSFAKARKDGQTALLSTTPEQLFKVHDKNGNEKDRKATEIAMLGPAILTDPNVYQFLNVDILEAIIDKRTLNPADRAKIKTYLTTATSSVPRIKEMKDWLNTPLGARF